MTFAQQVCVKTPRFGDMVHVLSSIELVVCYNAGNFLFRDKGFIDVTVEDYVTMNVYVTVMMYLNSIAYDAADCREIAQKRLTDPDGYLTEGHNLFIEQVKNGFVVTRNVIVVIGYSNSLYGSVGESWRWEALNMQSGPVMGEWLGDAVAILMSCVIILFAAGPYMKSLMTEVHAGNWVVGAEQRHKSHRNVVVAQLIVLCGSEQKSQSMLVTKNGSTCAA